MKRWIFDPMSSRAVGQSKEQHRCVVQRYTERRSQGACSTQRPPAWLMFLFGFLFDPRELEKVSKTSSKAACTASHASGLVPLLCIGHDVYG